MPDAVLSLLAGRIMVYVAGLVVDEFVSLLRVDDDLKQIDGSTRMIESVLLDAARRQSMGHAGAVSKELVRRLKKVLYDADDLLDKVFTVKNQTSHNLKQGSPLRQLIRKVILPFSKSGPIRFDSYVVGEIKSIRKELDCIVRDSKFTAISSGVTSRAEPGTSMSQSTSIWETFPSVNSKIIVGLEDEKDKIIEMLLLKPKSNIGSISVIRIVGMGGIGKTTLAQLVCNDDRVNNHFDLTQWVWLSVKDRKNGIIRKIFSAFTGRNPGNHSLEYLQSSIRRTIHDKKILLVLDNMWDENSGSWLQVDNFLSFSKSGSKIIVTTRSKKVLENVGPSITSHEMKFLSDKESWDLFKKFARPSHQKLIPIGKEIVKKCGNVPIVIRAIGSVLYGNDNEIDWIRVKDFQLSKMGPTGTRDVISLLKLSYDQLPSELQQCFAYFGLLHNCSSKFCRNHIIYCWMSLGFIKWSSGVQTQDLEDVGQQYFSELLAKNFFKDDKPDETGDIEFRVHDLMKDLAAHVIDDYVELLVDQTFSIDDVKHKLNDELRYLSLHFDNCDSWDAPLSFPNARQIRFLRFETGNRGVPVQINKLEDMLSAFISLRSLELQCLKIESVPEAIGQLIHLRLLLISSCPIKCLPSSIKSLCNLQTIVLEDCKKLEALPAGISRLINLRCLLFGDCRLLEELPPDFEKLKSLQRLSNFIVSDNNGLDALANMKLRENLEISYRIWREGCVSEASKANLVRKDKLNGLSLQFGHLGNPTAPLDLLQALQPPRTLKVLEIGGYQGKRLPSWIEDGLGTNLQKLIRLKLDSFNECHFILSRFCQLSCLKHLILSTLPELRGWSKVDDTIDEAGRHDGGNGSARAMFPCLRTLEIYKCRRLITMPYAPKLQRFTGDVINVRVLALKKTPSRFSCMRKLYLTSVYVLCAFVVNAMPLLKVLVIAKCEQLTSIMVESETSIEDLKIKECKRFTTIGGLSYLSSCLKCLTIFKCQSMRKLPKNMDCLKSLERLEITQAPKLGFLPKSLGQVTTLRGLIVDDCPELKSLPQAFNRLTQLHELKIQRCSKLTWSSFSQLLDHHTLLKRLTIDGFQDLEELPESMKHLSHLVELEITQLPKMRRLPKWFKKLTSLQILKIRHCPRLKKRCNGPRGEDWPLIQHISKRTFKW